MVRRAWMVMIGLCVVVLCCGRKPESGHQPHYGGTIRWTMALAPVDFSPFAGLLWNSAATNLIFEGLVRYSDDDFSIEPALATSWQVKDNGLTWVFQLRNEVTFHDGTPFNAAAVKFHFERILDPEALDQPADLSPGSKALWGMTTIKEIQILSDHEIAFVLEKPFAFLLEMLCQESAFIMSPASVSTWGDQVKYHPTGTGPFILGEYVPFQFCHLEANPEYYAGRPYVDALEFRSQQNMRLDVTLEMLSGAIDGTLYLSPVEAGLRRCTEVRIMGHAGMNLNYYVLGLERPPLNNKLVRQAMRYAFDQISLARRTSRNTLETALSILPSKFLPLEFRSTNRYPFNPEKARQLLARAGYPDGLTLSYLDLMSADEMAFQGPYYYLARSLEQVNITLEADSVTNSAVYEQRVQQNDFDIMSTQLFPEGNNPLLFIRSLIDFKVTPSGPTSHIGNDRIHQIMLDQFYGQQATSLEAAITEIVTILEEEAYFIPYNNVPNKVAVSNRLKGFKLHPVMARYNFHKVWKEK